MWKERLGMKRNIIISAIIGTLATYLPLVYAAEDERVTGGTADETEK